MNIRRHPGGRIAFSGRLEPNPFNKLRLASQRSHPPSEAPAETAPRIDRALWPLLILWILFAITMLAFYASAPGIETGAPMMPHR
jgi:hypothetical protein